MQLTFRKCVVKVSALTNPTQYTKSSKYNVKSKVRLSLEKSISYIFVLFLLAAEHRRLAQKKAAEAALQVASTAFESVKKSLEVPFIYSNPMHPRVAPQGIGGAIYLPL